MQNLLFNAENVLFLKVDRLFSSKMIASCLQDFFIGALLRCTLFTESCLRLYYCSLYFIEIDVLVDFINVFVIKGYD